MVIQLGDQGKLVGEVDVAKWYVLSVGDLLILKAALETFWVGPSAMLG